MPEATNNITVHFKAEGNKPLLKAIKELAKAQQDLNKQIEKAGTTLNAQRKRVEANSKTQEKHNSIMNKAKAGIAQYRNTILLGAFAVGLFSKTVGKLTSLFSEQEDAEKRLSTALGFTSERLLEFASAMQQVTTFGDEVTISAMAQAAAFTSNEKAIEQMTIAAQNMSAATGKDLNTSMELITKSIFSTRDALATYGIVVAKSNSLSEKFNNTIKALNNQYSGQAAGAVDTYSGATAQLSNSVGDLGEQLGEMLANALLPFVNALTGFTNILSVVTPILSTLTKITIAFAASIFLTTTRIKAWFAWTTMQTKAMLKLSAASKVTMSTVRMLGRAVAALVIIELAIRLFSSFSKKTEEAKVSTVELTSSIKDLDLVLAGLTKKKEFEGLIQSLDTMALMLNNPAMQNLRKSFGTNLSQDLHTAKKDLADLNTELLKSAKLGAKQQALMMQKISNKEDDISQIKRLMKLEEKLLAIDKDKVKINEKIRDIERENIIWIAGMIPKLELENEILKAKNTLSGAELKLKLLLIEAEARGADLKDLNIEKIKELIDETENLNNAMKQDLFIVNSFNSALVQGINNNGRFAESFGNMIKKMAAEMIAHMATFILFKSLIPGSGSTTALGYAISKMTGGSFGTAAPGSSNPGSSAGGAMQGISLENQNSAMQSGSGSVVINFSGNVMSQDFIENDAIPQIRSAIRRGADIGVG